MTAQITDCYRYKGSEMSLIAMSEKLDFDPRSYGFKPTAPHTACWRGYCCKYVIKYKHLYLDQLSIFCEDGNYPELFGISPKKPEGFSISGFHDYIGLNHIINYTGSIVLGKKFLDRYYIHMGFQRAEAYENVYEFKFVEGKLIEVVDHSEFVARLRAGLESQNSPSSVDICDFVNKSFSLDTKDKAWWID